MTGAGQGQLHRPLLGIVLRIAGMMSFAIMAVIAKLLAGTGLPENELLFFRNLFGLAPVLLCILVMRRPALFRTRRPAAHIVRALLGLASMICLFLGLARLPLNDATAIGFTMPIFAALMSAALLGERIGLHRGLAILAGFGGVIILTGTNPGSLLDSGAIFMLSAALLGAAVSVTVRQISHTEHSITITFYFMLAGVLVLGLTLPFTWVPPQGTVWLMLVALGLAGGLMQLLVSAALRYAPVSVAVPFDYTQILFTGFLSWAFLSELPTIRTIAGGTVIIASGLYLLYRETRGKLTPPTAATVAEEG